jgi:hypothetical protein
MTKTTQDFFSLYPNFLSCTIQTFDDQKQRSDKKLAHKFHPYDEAKCKEINAKGGGIFFSVNSMITGKRAKADVV